MSPKKPKKEADESLNQNLISLDEANKDGLLAAAVSKAVFDDKFHEIEDATKRLETQGKKLDTKFTEIEKTTDRLEAQGEKLDKKNNAMLLGGLFVAALFCLGIFVQAHYFMTSYNMHYLDTQDKFMEQIGALREENRKLKTDLEDEMHKVTEKQDYLEERLIIQGTR